MKCRCTKRYSLIRSTSRKLHSYTRKLCQVRVHDWLLQFEGYVKPTLLYEVVPSQLNAPELVMNSRPREPTHPDDT